MCDTVVIMQDAGVLFAKNSDRDANEAQVLTWAPAAEHPEGTMLACTWLRIPQARRTRAVVLSRPFWMWGAEMGVNDHDVAIGNEAIFTRRPASSSGLTGMDLVRLGLERSSSAAEALEVIQRLVSRHGQGGRCGYESSRFRYDSSFLIADPREAWVLETCGRETAAEPVRGQTRAISNFLSIPEFRRRHQDGVRTWFGAGSRRWRRTSALAGDVTDVMEALGGHGDRLSFGPLRGTLTQPCVHGGGALANAVTTASWISELREGGSRHWATATGAPCLSLYKPIRIDEPVDYGCATGGRYDGSLWWRHERLHRRVLRDHPELSSRFTAERDDLQRRWIEEPPSSGAAFEEASRRLAEWTRRVGGPSDDRRPPWARSYWRRRNHAAGLAD